MKLLRLKAVLAVMMSCVPLVNASAQAAGEYTRVGCSGGAPDGSFEFYGELIDTTSGFTVNGSLDVRYGFYYENFQCSGDTINTTVCTGSWGNENRGEVKFTVSQDQKIEVIFTTPNPVEGYIRGHNCRLY